MLNGRRPRRPSLADPSPSCGRLDTHHGASEIDQEFDARLGVQLGNGSLKVAVLSVHCACESDALERGLRLRWRRSKSLLNQDRTRLAEFQFYSRQRHVRGLST